MGYDNNNKGAIFQNEKKESDTHPDYKGNAEINGVEYWISGWINEAKTTGKKYMSLSFTKKDGTPKQKQDGYDSEIPF